MKTSIAATVVALLGLASPAGAQEMVTTEWEAYGVSFQVPAGFSVEDDSDEGYVLSDPTYYITVQLLEGGGDIPAAELGGELKNVATDDEVANQSAVTSFDLPQFHGVQLKGDCESDHCLYSYLLSKDGSCGLYISFVYKSAEDPLPERMLRSFRLQE